MCATHPIKKARRQLASLLGRVAHCEVATQPFPLLNHGVLGEQLPAQRCDDDAKLVCLHLTTALVHTLRCPSKVLAVRVAKMNHGTHHVAPDASQGFALIAQLGQFAKDR